LWRLLLWQFESPTVFLNCRYSLSCNRVIDEEAVLHAIGQGAIFQQVKGVRLLTFTRTDIPLI